MMNLKEQMLAPFDGMPPLSASEPCGPNLEYDPEYVMLMAKAAPKGDAQYGDFIGAAEAPNWSEIERDCRRVLLRSRDINILVLLLRCRTHIAQAAGLREGLALLLAMLEQYPDTIHPQAIIEGEFDLTVRANALATLIDPEGMLSDIREITLTKNSAMRLQVRDVERAFAIPRPVDALSVASVLQQINDLHRSNDSSARALAEAAQLSVRLQAWVTDKLGGLAPDLSALTGLVGAFIRKELSPAVQSSSERAPKVLACAADAADVPQAGSAERPCFSLSPGEFMQPADWTQGRDAALQAMIEARTWFEQAEPSSPVAVLLRQAEKLVGKRFAEVVQCIPLELLERWDQEHTAGN
ncbi:type VI secretion system protein TssA [Collimonas silvisoli]|uniref:type VI secretion system protein TssA n=1 Tax=Collimonas silvisoli TaxID=2825884 RepID=UPI001B8C3CBD|nr:type VI secretion system ImpA family N-terminal domain-containing protein [Collimonas silvisoli]